MNIYDVGRRLIFRKSVIQTNYYVFEINVFISTDYEKTCNNVKKTRKNYHSFNTLTFSNINKVVSFRSRK